MPSSRLRFGTGGHGSHPERIRRSMGTKRAERARTTPASLSEGNDGGVEYEKIAQLRLSDGE